MRGLRSNHDQREATTDRSQVRRYFRPDVGKCPCSSHTITPEHHSNIWIDSAALAAFTPIYGDRRDVLPTGAQAYAALDSGIHGNPRSVDSHVLVLLHHTIHAPVIHSEIVGFDPRKPILGPHRPPVGVDRLRRLPDHVSSVSPCKIVVSCLTVECAGPLRSGRVWPSLLSSFPACACKYVFQVQ